MGYEAYDSLGSGLVNLANRWYQKRSFLIFSDISIIGGVKK